MHFNVGITLYADSEVSHSVFSEIFEASGIFERIRGRAYAFPPVFLRAKDARFHPSCQPESITTLPVTLYLRYSTLAPSDAFD
jgi:hypothetical protein